MFVKKVLSVEGVDGTASLQCLCHAVSRAVFHHANSIKGIPLCGLCLPVRLAQQLQHFLHTTLKYYRQCIANECKAVEWGIGIFDNFHWLLLYVRFSNQNSETVVRCLFFYPSLGNICKKNGKYI
jgi:hypothetical protein